MGKKMSKKKFKMPSALILLFIVLVFVAILTWFIPTSVMTTDEKTGENVICYNASFDENGDVVRDTGTAPVGIWDVFMAPIKGFANGADVNFSILISGAFLAILNFAGAMDAGVGALLRKFSGKKLILILLSCLFRYFR